MENDFILEKDYIVNEESSKKHFPWILGIIYNIVVYRWAYVIISQLNSTEKKEFGILPHIVYFILLLILLILQIASMERFFIDTLCFRFLCCVQYVFLL